MATSKFPKVLYVNQDHDGDETFELAHRRLADLRDDTDKAKVAVYKLVRVGTLSITKELH